MGIFRYEIVRMMRRAGLEDLAAEALKTLDNEVDLQELRRFFDLHGVSTNTLMDRMAAAHNQGTVQLPDSAAQLGQGGA